MKSMVIMGSLAAVFILFSGPVWAGGPHGNYTNDTSACGSCHNTHAATGTKLIANMASGSQNSIYRICIYCHGGSGSKYNVVNGAVNGTKTSNAGGFTKTYLEGVGANNLVTSKHDVDGAEGATFWAPGYSTAAGDRVELTCASCHDPHSGTDRAFRETIRGQPVAPTLSIMLSGGDESIRYEDGWNEFCGACHLDFLQTTAGSGNSDSGAYSSKKRHRVNMDPSAYPGINSANLTSGLLSQPSDLLPLEYNNGSQQVSCLTCHFAHSTTKTNSVTFVRTDGTSAASSTLLRLQNRGVCKACHDK